MVMAYNHRAAQGVWINDMRNEAMPGKPWPHSVLDDRAVEDITACLELQSRAGFNEFDIFGLLATYGWEPDITGTVDEDRRRQVNRILKAAHGRKIKVLYGLGVYSWGFDKIIAADPVVKGTRRRAMCGSKPEAWKWMQKVIDYILSEFDIDGFHLESADQGRCTCESCGEQGDVEYHCDINRRTAEYIRSKWPEKVLMVNMCGFMRPLRKVTKDEFPFLVELSRHLDILIDPGHSGCYIADEDRREFIRQLHCDFGTSGGVWVYPPQGWDRLRWFLPHTMRTRRYFKKLYEDGGRAAEYYMGPTINPGVEVNIAFGGRLLLDVSRDNEEILAKVIEMLYRPGSETVRDKLVEIFRRAESAYFDNWNPQPIPPNEAPGEIHLKPLRGETHGPVSYLTDNCWGGLLMDATGRRGYKRELLEILGELSTIEAKASDDGRMGRIKTCIRNVLTDVEACGA